LLQLSEKSKPVEARDEVMKSEGAPSSKEDVGDEVQRGREDSVNEMNFFPNEKDLKQKEEEAAGMESIDVIQEEDNVRED